jgi:hypothetical protein
MAAQIILMLIGVAAIVLIAYFATSNYFLTDENESLTQDLEHYKLKVERLESDVEKLTNDAIFDDVHKMKLDEKIVDLKEDLVCAKQVSNVFCKLLENANDELDKYKPIQGKDGKYIKKPRKDETAELH